MGYGPERATTAAVGFLQGIHPAAVAASGNSSADADADADSSRAPPNAHELQPPKASRALFELKSEPAEHELAKATATASANGEHSSATFSATVTAPTAPVPGACARPSPPPPTRVLKDVVCFHAASYRQVSELLQLDLHEPPASQVRAILDA